MNHSDDHQRPPAESFRIAFALDTSGREADTSDSVLITLFRRSIRELLDVVDLYSGDQPLEIDGFRFHNENGSPESLYVDE